MRTSNLFVLAAAALLFVNCAQKEIDVPFMTGSAVAVMENESTKSNATDEGYFTWSTGDQITIHTSNGNLTGTLSNGNGTPNGTFSYSYYDGQVPSGYAMYPHSAGHAISENTLTFSMPATYDLGENISNTNAPMVARPTAGKGSATLNFGFSHLGGVFRFVFKNTPAGTDKFTLSLGGSKINGSFEVDLTAEKPQIATGTAADGEGVTTLTFDALESAQDITLFVPVPVGNYTGIEAKLYDDAGNEYHYFCPQTVVDNSDNFGPAWAPAEQSTLTGDLNVEFVDGAIYAECYGDYYVIGKNTWMYFVDDYATGDSFCFELLADVDAEYPVGTFPISNDLNNAQMALPGYVNSDGNTMWSWYSLYDDHYDVVGAAPIVGGEVDITDNGDDTFTVTINVVDDLGYEITGECVAYGEFYGTRANAPRRVLHSRK